MKEMCNDDDVYKYNGERVKGRKNCKKNRWGFMRTSFVLPWTNAAFFGNKWEKLEIIEEVAHRKGRY